MSKQQTPSNRPGFVNSILTFVHMWQELAAKEPQQLVGEQIEIHTRLAAGVDEHADDGAGIKRQRRLQIAGVSDLRLAVAAAQQLREYVRAASKRCAPLPRACATP